MPDTLALPDLFRAPIQFRSATVTAMQTDERIIELRAVPYGVETRLAPDVRELFQPRAFANATKDPTRVKLWQGHSTDGGHPVGIAELVDDRPDGVYVRAKVSDTPAGVELLTLARDGVLDEASIEFQPIDPRQRDGMVVTRSSEGTLVRHRRARLLGVALVTHGAYGRNATVLSVRDESSAKLRDEWLARLRCRTA